MSTTRAALLFLATLALGAPETPADRPLASPVQLGAARIDFHLCECKRVVFPIQVAEGHAVVCPCKEHGQAPCPKPHPRLGSFHVALQSLQRDWKKDGPRGFSAAVLGESFDSTAFTLANMRGSWVKRALPKARVQALLFPWDAEKKAWQPAGQPVAATAGKDGRWSFCLTAVRRGPVVVRLVVGSPMEVTLMGADGIPQGWPTVELAGAADFVLQVSE